MSQTSTSHEHEIKLRVPNPESGRERIEKAGLQLRKPRIFESNTVYDTADRKLRGQDSLLRLRQVGESCIFTYKGPPVPGRHKSREELEIAVSDFGVFEVILSKLGYIRVFRYDKFRTEYESTSGNTIITLDETPIGTFLEVEGAPDDIDEIASRLGFSESDYILQSYGALYRSHCERLGIAPGDLVFSS